ncbi:MAG: amidohydrolase [Defluviitaleaceae bacterium]|nr:amidohydrolase [Defluviitaleaceae bacterium]
MDKNQLKQQANAAIEANREAIIAFGKACRATPELGYAEYVTSAAVKSQLEDAGIQDIHHVALTGLKGWAYGKTHTAKVMIMGELDAVISPQHPHANPVTGAAHACGHAAQLAVLVGCAMGISAVAAHLDGDVCFAATPAEEYVQISERQALRREGKIAWLGGKQQMIAEGAFDDIDMAMMVHAETNFPGAHIVTGGTSLGFIGKEIRFIGKEAHAGSAPWLGVNALYAATLSLQAINALRETFRDIDRVRVHPIITKGGDIVNTVPADVRMECFVRAANTEAMKNVNAQVNRAIKGCAYALGAEVEIIDIPGYYPLIQNPCIGKLFAHNTQTIAPDALVEDGKPFGGSTDMGDVTWLLPAIHPSVSGFNGILHSAELDVADDDLAYILPAKLLTMTAIDLLADGAKAALEIKEAYPRKSKEEYAAFWDEIIKVQ